MAEEFSDVHQRIARNEIFSIDTGQTVTVGSLWRDKTCVISFLRRFGCVFCRMGAKELSEIKPILDAHDVKLIGIGLEELGAEEFVQGGFFSGELYLDTAQQCYKDLDYKRYNMFNMVPALFSKSSRDAIAKGRAESVPNNLKGDGMQAGGTMIVSAAGEKTLLFWKQPNPAEHLDPKLILEALGIQPE